MANFLVRGGWGERNKLVLASVQLPYQASCVRSTEQKKIAKLEQKHAIVHFSNQDAGV